MSFLFGRGKTPQEQMREHQRVMRQAIREMDRERNRLEQQEKKIIIEIKKMAKEQQMGAAKIMAKDLVRTRQQIQKFYEMRSYMQAVSLKIQTLKSTATMADAMKGVTRAMIRMNRSMNLPAMQRIMMEFERQSEIMEMKQEMIEETMDDTFELDMDEEAESDNILNQVLDEIGFSISDQLANAPNTSTEQQKAQGQKVAQAEGMGAGKEGGANAGSSSDLGCGPGAGPGPGAGDLDFDLQARLDNLRKP